ncbi:Sir2 family NAD-dependent protein deacetylase [Nocardia farcinica]|uniref:protein acetyllysine N-acetyltransferase n=2 Tax=Nocardia farcinica TaxID=37329 RepID=A0A0H5P7R1_NOCFR|nr:MULTISPECIES: Sir2 family NAD-dependent protein deacetylase [Nocardia]AXK88187.1 NAD-dependent deacetylase [Nocardia farcinica]MBA4854776.1 NAD-dependent deacetylase [Nocardia farcinica]MBC9815061.1 Sir2 family NAD-dependent protein deacetylase [Nocardia farcinica]MBF6185106.1 Sir2 family NAD-dependent protein deacetylase [Nocardia farcinica]MBF6233738.1 Sir2 family NAD-dependent protein deacetylase [Nocardia farcinica]
MTRQWRTRSGRIGVLTGAGISTDSGIPDFRGPRGVWTEDPIAELMSTYDQYLSDPDLRRRSWLARRANPAWQAEPNAGHLALVDLERAGRAVTIITQNVDRLHQRAGSSPQRVVEIHGNMFEVVCVGCDYETGMADVLARVEAGEPDPACPECGGILKAATIMFGQQLDQRTMTKAALTAQTSDIFLAIGTSLQVEPAASMCALAVDAGADLVIVNAEPTPYDSIATEVVHEPIGTALPRLVKEILDA